MTLSQEELKEIEARLNAATEVTGNQPWCRDYLYGVVRDQTKQDRAWEVYSHKEDHPDCPTRWYSSVTQQEPIIEFIAHAPTDIRKLLDDNKALKEANYQLQMQLDSMQQLIQNYLDNYGLTQEFEDWSNASS